MARACLFAVDAALQGRGFHSAYPNSDGSFTTSKWRDKVRCSGAGAAVDAFFLQVVTRVIDFIWHQEGAKPVALLEMPPLALLEPTHLPLLEFPSDHLSIAAVFDVK